MAMKGWENWVPPSPIGDDGRVALPKPSKYRNKKTTVDGITFDSAKEARRWNELKMLQAAGEIHGLERQVKYALFGHNITLHSGKTMVGHYVADFTYCRCSRSTENDDCALELVVEDVKGVKTDIYRLKAKLMKACYGIVVQEV